ncbi:unnamed protein product [Acanthoscelides obtectus]|uniref:Acylphosphatase n=1 Tax=Acanthoscelides obtectus TaxID=200917 RepID=A0A9P0KRW8_ACAOB|nr:unnamed protein product [Acanthoscelides obtectus]CAK1681343.1 Acylphosphatase-1 [Acanthoscelides obtectus]
MLLPFKLILPVFAVILLIYDVNNTSSMGSTKKLLSVNFEVFGRVQGVFFRKYTEKEANKLGLKGWCMNTSQGTVKGVIEGPSSKVDEIKILQEIHKQLHRKAQM